MHELHFLLRDKRIFSFGILVIQYLVGFSAHAGLYEVLSEGAFYVSSQEFCPVSDPDKVREAFGKVSECLEGSKNAHKQVSSMAAMVEMVRLTEEDEYFMLLARQHSRELKCASDFAGRIQKDDKILDELWPRLKLLREARHRLTSASQRLATDPGINSRVCPLGLDELKPAPLPDGQKDEYFELCKEIIVSRVAYQTILNSIPLANVPSVLSRLEAYANQSEENYSNWQARKDLLKGYRGAEHLLINESWTLKDKAQQPSGMDRDLRRSLLQDPRVITRVMESSGKSSDLKGVMCRADARYGAGAKLLDKSLLVGSLVLGGATGITARLGVVAFRVQQGAAAVRASGLLSVNSMRVLQISSLAVNSLASYSQIDKSCFSERNFSAKGLTEKSCVTTPTVEGMGADNCVLSVALSALGFVVTGSSLAMPKANPAITAFEKAADEMKRFSEVAPKVEIADIRLKNGMFNLSKSPIGRDKDAIYIGVANHPGEGTHHYYLVAGNKRYDGHPMFSGSTVRELAEKTVAMPQGVIFKINVPEKTMERVTEAINARAKSKNATCFHGLCNVLDLADVKIEGMKTGQSLRLKPVVNGLLDKKVTVGGSPLNSDQVKAYVTSEDQLRHFLNQLETAEDAVRKQFVTVALPLGVLGGGGAAMLGTTGYIIYEVVTEQP